MRLCVSFFCTPNSAGILFLAHARQHLMLFFLFLQIHTFHVFTRSCRGPHTGQARSTMKRVGGLEEGDQQPFQFESARLKYKPKPLSHFTFSARQRYFTTDSQTSFFCFIPHKKKRSAGRFGLQMAKTFCSWRNRHHRLCLTPRIMQQVMCKKQPWWG